MQNRIYQLVILAFVPVLLLLALVKFFPFNPAVRAGILLGSAVSVLNAILSFVLLSWFFSKSDRIFLGTFFGGMLWKLLALGLTCGYVFYHPRFNPAATLIAFGLATFFMNLFEAGLLRGRKKAIGGQGQARPVQMRRGQVRDRPLRDGHIAI